MKKIFIQDLLKKMANPPEAEPELPADTTIRFLIAGKYFDVSIDQYEDGIKIHTGHVRGDHTQERIYVLPIATNSIVIK